MVIISFALTIISIGKDQRW